jgi:uncharacterized membrane protein
MRLATIRNGRVAYTLRNVYTSKHKFSMIMNKEQQTVEQGISPDPIFQMLTGFWVLVYCIPPNLQYYGIILFGSHNTR